MKKIKLIGLVLAVAALSPVIVPVSIACIFLAILTLLVLCLCYEAAGSIAINMASGRHRRLLRELHKIGTPLSDRELDDLYWCSNPNHADECTPRTCVFKQAEEYWRLVHACGQEHVPEWRIHWAA